MKNLVVSLGLALLLAGCKDSASYSIDNPTDQPLSLTIDDTTYQVDAHGSKSLSLKAGEHTMKGAVVGDLTFISYYRGRGGIINPTLGDYVVFRQSYVKENAKVPNGMGKPEQVVLDGVTFEGPMKQVNGLFIDKDWTYEVDEALPDSVTEHDNGLDNTVHQKVFRAKDFIAFFEKNADAQGYFEANRPKDVVPVVRKVALPPELPRIDDPAYEDHTGPLREVYAKYLKATDPSTQEALQKDYFRESMAFTQATMMVGSKATREANEQADTFIHTLGEVIGSTALVERR